MGWVRAHAQVHVGRLLDVCPRVTECWSATQVRLALSSGKAEYYGVVRAAGIGLGMQALLRDSGVNLPVRVWTHS